MKRENINNLIKCLVNLGYIDFHLKRGSQLLPRYLLEELIKDIQELIYGFDILNDKDLSQVEERLNELHVNS